MSIQHHMKAECLNLNSTLPLTLLHSVTQSFRTSVPSLEREAHRLVDADSYLEIEAKCFTQMSELLFFSILVGVPRMAKANGTGHQLLLTKEVKDTLSLN